MAPHVKCYAATNERDDDKSSAVNIPSTFPPRVYYLGVIVDANDNQIKSDETSNSLYLGTPDLVCTPTQICVQ